jgi:hypothetical protein
MMTAVNGCGLFIARHILSPMLFNRHLRASAVTVAVLLFPITFRVQAPALVQSASSALQATQRKAWDVLKHVTRSRGYALVLRDGSCLRGTILSVKDKSLEWKDGKGTRSIQPDDLLRISDVGADAHDAIFSNRSSWSDVKAARPAGKERLVFVLRDGRRLKSGSPALSDEGAIFAEKSLSKSDVRYVYYTRYKPLTDKEAYVHHENVDILAPRLWFGYALLGTIDVLLYDADRSEDNRALSCRY